MTVPQIFTETLNASRHITPEYLGELDVLIEDLDLEFWGVERVEKTEN